jgi:glyoxylase I family protein
MKDPLESAIRASFPQERWAHVEALLAGYGTEPHEREVERVRLAILKISEGDERKVEEHVATAKKDYRDVLFWADQPEQAKLGPAGRKNATAALRKLGFEPPPMVRLKALDHVGLTVSDMDKTIDFYRRLGLTVLRTSGPGADGVRTAVIQAGSQELNVFAHSKFTPGAQESRAGIDHFCFEVEADSIDDVIAHLLRVGIEVVAGPVERRDGTALFVRDPDGVRVELQLKRS